MKDNLDTGRAVDGRGSPCLAGPFTARWKGAIVVPLMIRDLSVGGCMVLSTSHRLPPGVLTLEIDLSDDDQLTLQAEPLSLRPPVGFVVGFINLSQLAELRLKRFVANAMQNRAAAAMAVD